MITMTEKYPSLQFSIFKYMPPLWFFSKCLLILHSRAVVMLKNIWLLLKYSASYYPITYHRSICDYLETPCGIFI